MKGYCLRCFLVLGLLLIISFANKTILAQGIGSFRGVVTDSSNGEALAFANVYIEELSTGASSDTRGYFVITSLPANKTYRAIISYLGYRSKTVTFTIQSNKVTHIEIELSSASVELGVVQKIGQRVVEKNATDIGLQRISMRELESLPKGVETDIFRSLQYMPGVQTTGDVSAKFFVRGGASNQNLILLDKIPIYNPFHAIGLFSVIDPEMINNVEFFKGGFTAEYGGRLSSVLSINSKDGNQNRFAGNFSSSFLTAKALIEGPIPYGSFIISGRKSYSADILKKFLNDKNVPAEFYDLAFKVSFSNPNLIEGSKISAQGFFSHDDILNPSPFIEDYTLENNAFGFRWFQVGDVPLFFEIGVSVSTFDGELIPKFSGVRPKKNELSDVGLEMDFTYIFDSKDEIALGLHIHDIQTKLFLENSLGSTHDVGGKGTQISFYTKYKLLRYESLGIDIGNRFNLTRLKGSESAEYMFEPRISLTYRLHPLVALKAAAGLYQQEITTLSDDNELLSVFEPWFITPEYIEPARAVHYTAGIDYDMTETMKFSLESYYKKINSLPLLNEEKLFPNDPDLVSGEGESYGVEAQYCWLNQWVSFTLSYSRSWAYKILNGRRYYPKYDQRNSGSVLLELNLGKGWKVSSIWNYNSGLPFTKKAGFYDYASFTDYYSPWYTSFNSQPDPIFASKNLGRLPDYHRLDLSISKKIDLSFFSVEINASVINVYDRENIFYFNKDTGERVNMLPMIPTATIKVEL
ncbi:MAG: TonB-dependent receptor [Bacteroidetes bacterium]|nr:TonB-dependent receptor [Bacteroidota bacterium]